ncbi:MAG: phage tail protein, partial [Candidatus Saccharimonadales bacterium]
MDNFIGEIRVFGGGVVPKGWASCAGQLLSIQQNSALFSLLGTYYGGNGTNNFALPDFRGRTMLGMGDNYVIGEIAGTEGVTLNQSQLAAHTHLMRAQNVKAAAR